MITRSTRQPLSARLTELASKGDSIVQLDEAMLLARASCDEVIASYEEARATCIATEDAYIAAVERGAPEAADLKNHVDVARRMALAAGANLRQTLNELRGVNLDAARIREMTRQQFTPEMARAILSQCVSLMHEVCGQEHEDIAYRFESAVFERVRIGEDPKQLNVNAPRITVDSDARRMMGSVPEWDGEDDDDA